MKNLIMALIVYGSYGSCGFPPFPPFGCDSDDAVCVCDANGDCEWHFICERG